jgi:BASS family bile acid:Na+ symporter
MTLQAAFLLGIKLSIVLAMFAHGLNATISEITYLFRRPAKFARSILAIDFIMPLFAFLVLAVTDLPGPVRLALAALSVSPVEFIMPKRQVQKGFVDKYFVGLLVAVSVIALAFVPLSVELLGRFWGVEAQVPVSTVAILMLETILGPLIAGCVVRKLRPRLAEQAATPLAKLSLILLVLCAVPILRLAWPQVWLLADDGALASFAAFVLVGLATGQFLGGPDPEDRTVLAVATASRHPSVALTIAASSFPAEKLVVPAVLMYLLVNGLVSSFYASWRSRSAADNGAARFGRVLRP